MGWFNQIWSHDGDKVEIRDGEVLHNNERIGRVDGDKLQIGRDTVSIHPHDGDIYVNNQKIGYRDNRGDYHIENKAKWIGDDEWRRES